MQQTSERPARNYGWGILASVSLHALLAALLIFGLPLSLPEPEKPDAIAVELVPEQPEEAKSEEPEQPDVPAKDEPKAEQATGAEQANASSPQVLRPVFEFGDKDAGPRQSDDGNASTEPETPPEEPLPEPDQPAELTEAKTLYSQGASQDLVATTAMAGLTRGERARELCATELREQLRHATPPYRPDLLPAYRLDTGTAMQVKQGAFRAGGQWYDLRFRCDIDADATKVVSFAFSIGTAIPRGEWRSRGFPDS